MSYLYETHLHTSQVSNCGKSRGAEFIKPYSDLGYTGIFVTDHFSGNVSCKVDRNLPWKEWVNRFCEGYEDARNEGERRGLDVFFGWEETFEGDDYLIYGLDKNWLLEHPEARDWTRKEQYDAVKRAGGAVIQAHPFRQHDYIKTVHLSTVCVDGVEVANASHYDLSYDALAMRYSQVLRLSAVAGSDIHNVKRVEEGNVFGVYLKQKIENAAGYAHAIKEGGIERLHIPEGYGSLTGNETVSLPVDIRDENDNSSGGDWRKLLKLT
ncbi:MAG: histidinol-phosphatase [Treponema sp.]|jgi:hypothetical protein|nr:histidinol-phosphatase [Treponema sp.]